MGCGQREGKTGSKGHQLITGTGAALSDIAIKAFFYIVLYSLYGLKNRPGLSTTLGLDLLMTV